MLMSDLAMTVAGVPPAERCRAQQSFSQQPGQGAFIQPIARLLRPRCDGKAAWTGQHVGALLSAMSDRQWPQSRHYRVGHDVAGPNCLLCVHAGRCTHDSRDPRFLGSLTHRLFVCPSLQPLRDELMPRWLRDVVQTHLRPDCTLPPELVPLLTRCLVGHPSTWLPRPTEEATFHWHVSPGVCGRLPA